MITTDRELLTQYIDAFPVKEKETLRAIASKDKNAAGQAAAGLCDLLRKIGYTELADKAANRLKEFDAMDMGGIEAFLVGFLSEAAAVSIDMQMVIFRNVQKKEQPAPVPEPLPESPAKKKHILAVDDAAFFLTTLKNALKDTDYNLTCVNSGRAALMFLDRLNPDLFILDIEMPQMDGYELAAQIRKRGINKPIIFMTGNAAKEYVQKAFLAGASDFIVKPVNAATVLERVAKHI